MNLKTKEETITMIDYLADLLTDELKKKGEVYFIDEEWRAISSTKKILLEVKQLLIDLPAI